jgi:hypothetical protein
MATVISPVLKEKFAVPDFYPEPAEKPPVGESTIPMEIPFRVLKGALIGLIGAVMGVAMMWTPISSGDWWVVAGIAPQVAMAVMIVTGYIVALVSVSAEDGPAKAR